MTNAIQKMVKATVTTSMMPLFPVVHFPHVDCECGSNVCKNVWIATLPASLPYPSKTTLGEISLHLQSHIWFRHHLFSHSEIPTVFHVILSFDGHKSLWRFTMTVKNELNTEGLLVHNLVTYVYCMCTAIHMYFAFMQFYQIPGLSQTIHDFRKYYSTGLICNVIVW